MNASTYPRTRPMDRSTSKARAMSKASGFNSATALSVGLTSSIRSMKACDVFPLIPGFEESGEEEHTRTRLTLVSVPLSKRTWRSSMLMSSSRGKAEGFEVAGRHWCSPVGLDKAVQTTEKTYTSLAVRLSCITRLSKKGRSLQVRSSFPAGRDRELGSAASQADCSKKIL